MQPGRILSVAALAVGVLYYILSIAGVLYGGSTSPGDVGLVSTTGVFVLLGALGLYVTRPKPVA